jgi:uncharacterized protein involved in exopolysaccharide biosynthesis
MEEDDKGISLMDTVIAIKKFFVEWKKNWVITALVILIATLFGFLVSFFSKPKYVASSTMMLETSKGNGMSSALALASQFGLGGGGGGGSTMNEDKLLEIIKAETIIKTALFQKATIDSTTDLLANHFINLFGYRDAWKKNEDLKNFTFEHSSENLTLKENTIFKMFYSKVIKDFLKIDKSKSGIIIISITSSSESFSKSLNEYLVRAVTSFYVEHITKKEQINVDIIQKRVDSVSALLADAELALARWKDATNQLVKAQGMIAEMRLRRNVEVLNSVYIEGIKQLEISKFALLDETPFLQIIDEPIFPLNTQGEISYTKGIITGFFIGFLLAILYVFVREKYSDLLIQMNEMDKTKKFR